MKKIITILLSMVLLLAFTACGGGSDSSSSDKSKETEAPKIEKNIDAAAEALGLDRRRRNDVRHDRRNSWQRI